MTANKSDSDNNLVTPSVIRAMGLLPGATESDVMARVTAMRGLELEALAITGAKDSSELVGAIRGIKAKADGAEKTAAELLQVKGERDAQNFGALIMKGTSNPVKLSVATAKLYQDRFDKAVKDDAELKDGAGRTEAVVKDLTGFLAVAPTIIAPKAAPPAKKEGETLNGAGLTYNGKSYADMKPLERSKLSREDNELHNAMRQDWLDAGSPPPAAKSA